MPDIIMPNSGIAWLQILTLLGIGVFKLFRGHTLRRNATFFDGLGMSTIAFDYVLGSAYLIGVFWTVVPAAHTPRLEVVVLTSVTIAAGWAFYEVRRASQWRIERAVSSGHSPDSDRIDPDFPTTPGYTGIDRRSRPYGRRVTDRPEGDA